MDVIFNVFVMACLISVGIYVAFGGTLPLFFYIFSVAGMVIVSALGHKEVVAGLLRSRLNTLRRRISRLDSKIYEFDGKLSGYRKRVEKRNRLAREFEELEYDQS